MRLIPAVVLTALLGIVYWVGATVFTDRIQNDITERSTEAIAKVNPEVELDVDGRDVTLLGRVNTQHDRTEAKDTVDSVWGVRASRNLLELKDEYAFTAINTDSALSVSGVVDSENAISHMKQAINPVVATGTVASSARPMIKSPEKLALGAGTLLMLKDGKLEINEQAFTLTGNALDDQAKAMIEQKLASQRSNIDPLKLITDIQVVNSMTQACREQLEKVVDTDTVHFAVDSTVITEDYKPTVAAFATLLDNCPGMLVVEAHADQDGSEKYNLQLSERRARAVAELIGSYASDSGDRIFHFAYGETRPVASNESTHDKLFNRRVDIEYVHDNHPGYPTMPQTIISSQSAE